jgi:hypothetical protein
MHGELALGLGAEPATSSWGVLSDPAGEPASDSVGASRLAEVWDAASRAPSAGEIALTPQTGQGVASLVGEILEPRPARLAEPDDVCLL